MRSVQSSSLAGKLKTARSIPSFPSAARFVGLPATVATGRGTGRQLYVYRLQLADQCWYVGSTSRPQKRLEEHASAVGSEWSRSHLPILQHTCVPIDGDERQARMAEDADVKKLMLVHGIAKVRGKAHYIEPARLRFKALMDCFVPLRIGGGAVKGGEATHQ